MDIALILDLSGSVETVRDLIMAFATQFVSDLAIGSDLIRISLINYADEPDICFYLDSYSTKRGVLNALVAKFYGGRTGTAAAIQTMYQDVFTTSRGDRRSVDNFAILVSDGGSNIDRDQTIPRAEQAKQRGIIMYSVVVGESPSMNEMEEIANSPSTEYMVRLQSTNDIKSASNDLINKLCTN